MRKTLLLTVLTISTTLAASCFAGDDDLFSKVRLNTTATSNGTTTQPLQPQRPQSRTVSDLNMLQSVLLGAGYSARLDENDAISIDVSRSDWTAAVVITLTQADRQLRLAMPLTKPEADTAIAPKTLRGMLQANRTAGGAFFAIAGDPQHIELVKTIPNAGLDSDRMKAELDAMADMAEKTKALWKTDGVQQPATRTEPEATTPATTTPAASTPAATISLTGKWIASPSTNEAFALQLDEGTSFRLVHVKGTESNKSKGTYTLTGTTLTLKGDDGTTISGSVSRQSDRFTLTMTGADGKSFSLTFKSGS